MAQDSIVQIVPSLPPAINALADYCYKTWEHWPQPRPVWTCLSPIVPDGAREFWPDVNIVPFELNRQSLVRALTQSGARRVALQYVGYAYNAKGAPVWLPGALAQWKRESGGELCVMFHELWPVGFSPRTSAFWLAPFAKKIVVQLAQTADSWISSCDLGYAQLVERAGADPARGSIVPIGANIEPTVAVDFARPWPLENGGRLRVAVFGLPGTRLAALQSHVNLLRGLVERGAVETISLIGKSGDAAYAQTLGELQRQITPDGDDGSDDLWQPHADLSAPQISELLLRHHLDVSRNPPELLFKSGAYAAACVHGLLTVCPPQNAELQRAIGVRLDGSGTTAPHLVNDDTHPQTVIDQLHDARLARDLRARVEQAANHTLDWPSVVRAWQKSMKMK